jgi:hypothetical protein
LHSGLNPRGFRTGDESLIVGFGVVVLAGALLLFRKWFWASSKAGSLPMQQPTYKRDLDGDGSFVLTDPAMLADFPVYLWAERSEPFKTWHSRDTIVPAKFADLFEIAAHVYLFFLWHILVSKEFGAQVAARVRTEQINRIDRLGNSMGQHLFAMADEIQRVMTKSVEDPMPVPGQPNMQVPHIYGVALYILAAWKDSPYYIDPGLRGTNPPDMKGHDFVLAECLAHCADEGGRYFSNLLKTVTIDARVLTAWAMESNSQSNDTRAYQPGADVGRQMAEAVQAVTEARFKSVQDGYLNVLRDRFRLALNQADAPPITLARIEYNVFIENVGELKTKMPPEFQATLAEWVKVVDELGIRAEFDRILGDRIDEFTANLLMLGLNVMRNEYGTALSSADDAWRAKNPELSAQYPKQV